jgi:hypothetical protein
MKDNRSLAAIAVIWLIATAVTVSGFFLLNIAKTDLNYWSFGCLIAAELLTAAGIMFIYYRYKSGRTGAKVGLTFLFIFYFAAAVVASFTCNLFPAQYLNRFIFLEIAIHAVLVIIFVLILLYSYRPRSERERPRYIPPSQRYAPPENYAPREPYPPREPYTPPPAAPQPLKPPVKK